MEEGLFREEMNKRRSIAAALPHLSKHSKPTIAESNCNIWHVAGCLWDVIKVRWTAAVAMWLLEWNILYPGLTVVAPGIIQEETKYYEWHDTEQVKMSRINVRVMERSTELWWVQAVDSMSRSCRGQQKCDKSRHRWWGQQKIKSTSTSHWAGHLVSGTQGSPRRKLPELSPPVPCSSQTPTSAKIDTTRSRQEQSKHFHKVKGEKICFLFW